MQLDLTSLDLGAVLQLTPGRAERIGDRHVEILVGVIDPRIARHLDDVIGDRDLDPHVERLPLPLAAVRAPVRIDIAYGGSCTAGKREDFDHYHAVLRWAADQGLRVAPHVQLFLQFGTTAVRDHCVAAGYMDAFERVGARMLQPSCGACGNCGPGGSTDRAQVTVSAINRNFPGRGGPGQVWLASPPTMAASAIAGELVSFEMLQQRHA